MFNFRGRPGDLIKIVCRVSHWNATGPGERRSVRQWFDNTGARRRGACLFMTRLEKARFVRPSANKGKIALTSAQLPMLVKG